MFLTEILAFVVVGLAAFAGLSYVVKQFVRVDD